MKKALKTFFIYLGILVGLCALALAGCIIAMVFFHAHILGYKYVSYKGTYQAVYDFAANDVSAIKVNAGRMDVNIVANNSEDSVIVNYRRGLSGFTGAKSEEWSYNHTYIMHTFRESSDMYKTLSIDIKEPDGLLFADDYYITVSVPAGLVHVIDVTTTSGKIIYNIAEDNPSNIDKQLYLTTTKGSIGVYNAVAEQIYLETTSGEAGITSENAIDGELYFETNSGRLNVSQTLNGNLTVSSDASRVGPYIRASKLYGDVTVLSPYGKMEATQIGSETAARDVVLSTKSFKVNIGTLYGKIYASSAGTSATPNINVKINYLISKDSTTDSISFIASGNGDINIGYTDSPIVLATNSGDINIASIKQQVEGAINISAGKNSNVSINYAMDTMESDVNQLVTTIKNGSLTIKNIRYLSKIIVDDNSKGGLIDLTFVDVKGNLSSLNTAYNQITCNNHRLVMKINNSKSYRIVLDQPAKSSYSMGETSVLGLIQTTKIVEGSADYLHKEGGVYKYQARINYSESEYTKAGSMIIVSTGGSVTADGYVPQ